MPRGICGLASLAFAALTSTHASAADVIWQPTTPGVDGYHIGANWVGGTPPGATDTAVFGNLDADSKGVLLPQEPTSVAAWKFDAGQSGYIFTVPNALTFTGAGIEGGGATIASSYQLTFSNGSSAGSATISNAGQLVFLSNSTAADATLTNESTMSFFNTASAGNANITNNSGLTFLGDSTAGNATITTSDDTRFIGNASGDNARFITTATGTVDISGLTSGTTAGSIEGAGEYVLGNKSFKVGSNNIDTEVNGIISGVDGSLSKVGTGTLTLSGTNTYTGTTDVTEGKLVVDGSIGSSSQIIVASGGTLGGSGTVSNLALFSGSTLAPGNSIGTLNAASANFKTGMTYEVEVNSAGASDLLNVAGATVIEGGKVVVLPFPDFAVNTPYTIVTSADPIAGVGEFDEVEFGASSLFLSALLTYDTNNVFLTINKTSFADVAVTLNQAAAASAADSLGSGDPVYDAILKLGTAQQAQQAFDAISGEVHASVAGVLIEDSRYVRDAIFGRLLQASYGGGSASAVTLASNAPATAGRMSLGATDKARNSLPPTNDLAFWAQGYGAWGSIDGNGNAATVDRTLGGFVTGVDANIGSGWRAGIATGYARSNLGIDARLSSGDVDSYQLAGYLGGRLGDFALRGGGAWTWSSIDTNRTIAFAGFLDHSGASYSADTGQLFGEVALPLSNAATAWEPFARLTYVQVDTGGFTEGGTAALTSSGENSSLGYSTLGVRIATTTRIAGAMLTPHASVAWQHAIGDVSPTQTLAFASGGIAFNVLGAPLARDSGLIDAGLTLAVAPDAALSIAYSGQFAGDVNDNAVTGRFDWRF
jgi:outer membrane autotransporter protein